MKSGRNLDIKELNQAELNPDDPRAYLEGLYQYVKGQAIYAINWYLERKGPISAISKFLKLSSIILASLGAIFPFLNGIEFIEKFHGLSNNFSQFGYICLALAGTFVLLDKLFGFSNNWIRYMSTVMRLQTLLAKFEMDWAALMLYAGTGSIDEKKQNAMIECLTGFRLNVAEELKNETQKWIEEFKSNIDQLEKYTEAGKPSK